MLTDKLKNILLIVLTGLVVMMGSYLLHNSGEKSIHPSLVPVNVSGDKEKPEYKSPYEQNQVKNTIVKNNPQIQECYLKHLEEKDAVSSGRVRLDWNISPEGEVLSPQVISSSMNNSQLDNCILGKFKEFKFPAPPSDKPVYTTFTYIFRKEGESMAPKMVPVVPDPENKKTNK